MIFTLKTKMHHHSHNDITADDGLKVMGTVNTWVMVVRNDS